jgi:hypothetical protein
VRVSVAGARREVFHMLIGQGLLTIYRIRLMRPPYLHCLCTCPRAMQDGARMSHLTNPSRQCLRAGRTACAVRPNEGGLGIARQPKHPRGGANLCLSRVCWPLRLATGQSGPREHIAHSDEIWGKRKRTCSQLDPTPSR